MGSKKSNRVIRHQTYGEELGFVGIVKVPYMQGYMSMVNQDTNEEQYMLARNRY